MRAVLAWLTDAALADSILGDLKIGGTVRQAWRSIARRPGFACCTILLLALGLGANTAVFSIVRAVLLRPLPYIDPGRLALIWGGPETNPGNRHFVMTGEYVAGIGQQADLFDSWSVVESWEGNPSAWADLIGPNGAERLRGTWVTPNLFETLGVGAATGRTFTSADRDLKVAVISDALWRRRFAADPHVIGTTISIAVGRVDRRFVPFTVVGVLPGDFRFTYPRETEIYLPRPWTEIRPTRALAYYVVARLAPGIAPPRAQAQLSEVARRIERGFVPPQYLDEVLKHTGMLVEPIEEHMRAEVRAGIWLLAAVAALVLLIACVNLGLLLLSRTVDRRGELAVRAALGASRGQLVRQLAAECLILSVSGGILGVMLAALAQPLVRWLMPPVVPRADQISVDPGVLAFAAGAILLTAFVCSLAPAWFAFSRDLLSSVRGAALTTTGDRSVVAWRRGVLVLQVAVVVFLLVGSGLLLRSFWRLQHVDLGFSADGVVTMEMRLLNPKYFGPGRLAAFNRELMERVRAIPGVAKAGVTTAVPMRGVDFRMLIGPEGKRKQVGNARTVDSAYFSIMHLRLLAGRVFTDADTASSEPVVVVSESYGRQYFGTASPLDQILKSSDGHYRIVGVVADTRYADAAREPFPAFYMPLSQDPSTLLCLIAEPQPGMRAAVAEGMRAAVQALDPEQPVEGITTIDQIVSQSTADRRFYAVTTGAFAFVALALAIAGVFGVVSRTVGERTRELAIRLALGAEPQRLLTIVYGYGLVPAAVGVAFGLAAAFAASRLLQSFLFEIAPTDLATYAGAAAIVLAVTAAACYLPARRTLRVPPMLVLKTD